MDRVRLGRVLGRGARMAARTAFEALDAATTPSPSEVQRSHAPASPSLQSRPRVSQSGPGGPAVSIPQQSSRRPARVRKSGIVAPFLRASRAVTLEVAGSFFALFALPFAIGMWRARAEAHDGLQGMSHLLVYAAVTVFFVYCSVSSFVRARRQP